VRRPVALAIALLLAVGSSSHVAIAGACNRAHPCPPPLGVGVGRLLTAGAETNDLVNTAVTLEGFQITNGSPTTPTTQPRSGSRLFKFDSGAGSAQSISTLISPILARTYWLRFYVYYIGAPSSFDVRLGGFLLTMNIYAKTDGTLVARNVASPTVDIGSTTAVLTANTWYRIELMQIIRSGSADDDWEFRLDGVTISSQTGATIATSAPAGWTLGVLGISGINSGNPPASYVTYMDDVAINDDQGASQNTWPGAGSVVLLVPTADSARGTGWVNDANAASNFFDATDNTPPVGIADTTSSTGLHQIRNGTNNANSSYDATMTTYTAAGIAAGATINVVDPIVATAAPVSTSAKQGTVGVVSNPAITNVALGADGTSGAFWSGVAGGTYPTGWKISHGTTTYAPSVTLGTAPVMRITQVTGSTRIAVVCFMGIYVDYTPAAATSFLIPHRHRGLIVR